MCICGIWAVGLIAAFLCIVDYRCMSVLYERMSIIASFDQYIYFLYGDHPKRYAIFVVILYLIIFF